MPLPLDRKKVRICLEEFDLRSLFIDMLGWDHGGANIEAAVADKTFTLEAVAHKRGLVVYQYIAESDDVFPDHPTRRKIEKPVAKSVREHIIVYATYDKSTQYWQWVKREQGRPDRPRQHIYHQGQSGEALTQKLEQLAFTLDEEEDLTIVDVSGRVRAAFDVEKVTRRFYDRFKKEHHVFLEFIEGVRSLADREWYASLMLNRMMFIYFIQKQGFLDGDPDYLHNRLQNIKATRGKDRFQTFYRLFLLRLFHEGLGQPEADRTPELAEMLGRVPYLNGGLFDVHDLERDNPEIHIPDKAFEQIFSFFDAYQWHLDDRPLHKDNEINPDVLGYIFEKYINQKQMGAYYTKEDITGYISRNSIIPFLFDQAKKDCSIAFKPGGGVWRLLSDEPDRYFYESVRHGITYDIEQDEALKEKRELPPEITEGLNDVSQRDGWNKPASPEYALPTETWREHVARRQRYEEVRAKLEAGEITSINDLITYNLDIEKFAQDVITGSEGPELVRAFWKALNKVSVLDPTCGSGAFLFAALNILEPLYTACLETMSSFLEDLKRSRRKHRPEKMGDFRKILDQVSEHASERYFILKSIIVNSLYGVDIMEEAVEICKLRLFLKLVAQLESYDQIEPLPDIDFNVRAGNTLVGFASMEELKRAVAGDWVSESSLPEIEERAEISDRAFRKFREMQIDHGMDAEAFADAKLDLRNRLDDLRAELDHYLASEYGISADNLNSYKQWRDSHQPFHWFVEFYGIMSKGGFDVIIGNPPYVEYQEVKMDYTVSGYKTLSCGNLYAFILERNTCLTTSRGRSGMIVSHSVICTDRMGPVQEFLIGEDASIWVSSYDIRPAKLFVGVDQRLAVYLIALDVSAGSVFSSRYHRWHESFRPVLFPCIQYVSTSTSLISKSVPKVHNRTEEQLLRKLLTNQPLKQFLKKNIPHVDDGTIYFHNAPRYWIRAMDFAPYFWNERDGEQISTQVKPLNLATKSNAETTVATLNSSLFYWWFLILSDCRHLNLREIESFPLKLDRMPKNIKAQLEKLSNRLMTNFKLHKKRKEAQYKTTGKVVYDEFDLKPSKPIIDEVDRVLANHYGFTDEELDFIINYDIKYRMGLSSQSDGV